MSGIEFKTAIHLTPRKDAPDETGLFRRLFKPVAVFLLLASLHLYFYTHLSESRRDGGWPSIVLHNWHETGYWPLHGQLVANPGGLESGEEQFIYPGHRPTFLIPPYLLKELPGAAFRDGALYDFAVLAATYAAMLALFGLGWRGMLLGCVVCFTPGFINNVAAVDTINVPALLGLAVMGFAASRFARQENDISAYAVAFGVTLVFMCLNWSTLFSLGIAAVYVFCKRTDWKSAAVFFAPPLLIGLIVLAVSMHSKHTGTTGTSGDFWNAYLWGPLGYDRAGMTLGKAFVRISAVNVMAWLSLAVAGLVVLVVNGLGEKWRRAPWPLLAGIAAVFALRNYNAHHPWNSVCLIGLGLLFSIELLTGQQPLAFPKWQRLATAATVAFTLVFAMGWLALDDFNNRSANGLRELVVKNTPRHAVIVVADGLLPSGPSNLKDFSEMFDRKLVALEGWEHPTNGVEFYLLTHTNLPDGVTPVGQSHLTPAGADKIIAPLMDFYREKISRRAPGNRKEYFDDFSLGKY